MKYINTITGAVLDTASIIEGKNWIRDDTDNAAKIDIGDFSEEEREEGKSKAAGKTARKGKK